MAYMSQKIKADLAPQIKSVLKKYGIKGTLATTERTLILNIKSGPLDFIGNYNKTVEARPGGFRNGSPADQYMSVNKYWYQEQFTGKVKSFIGEVLSAMNKGNWDRSNSQIDYFDVGWYVDINIGKWNKPYILEK
jgi:hypothetical protein